MNDGVGLNGSSELNKNVDIVVEERQSSADVDCGDDIEPTTTYGSRGSWVDNRGRDGSPFQVCRASFHQSWHEDFQCPGEQCSSIALTALL